MKRIVSVLVFGVSLGGCAPQMRPHLTAFYGRPIDPVSQEQVSTECSAKAQVASASVPYGYGSSSGFARALEQGEVQKAAFVGCMAEKGVRVTWVPVSTQPAGQTASITK